MTAPLPLYYPFPLPVYRASTVQSVPAAAADFVTLTGAANKLLYVLRAGITGLTIGTAAILTTHFSKRSAADTGGTSGAVSSVALDSGWPNASGTVLVYSAAPTNGAGTFLQIDKMDALAAAGSAIADRAYFDGMAHPVILRGTAQQFTIGFVGAPATSPSVSWWIEWAESTT